MLVQKLRLQRGWSQQQLAELSGLSVRTIQRIEQGSGATVETWKDLAMSGSAIFTIVASRPAMNEPSAITITIISSFGVIFGVLAVSLMISAHNKEEDGFLP